MEINNMQKYLQKFTEEELSEVRSYIRVHVPYALLNEIYPLTEKYDDKAKVFTTQYRILYSIQQLVSNTETKIKIGELLDEFRDVYYEVYNLLLQRSINLNYGKSMIDRKLIYIFKNQEYNDKINSLCSLFLIFSEVIEPINFNTITAINMETKEGQKLYKDINTKEKKSEIDVEEKPVIQNQEELSDDLQTNEIFIDNETSLETDDNLNTDTPEDKLQEEAQETMKEDYKNTEEDFYDDESEEVSDESEDEAI